MRTDSKTFYALLLSLILHGSIILVYSLSEPEPVKQAQQQKKMVINLKKAYAAPVPVISEPKPQKQIIKKQAVKKKPAKKKAKTVRKVKAAPIAEKKAVESEPAPEPLLPQKIAEPVLQEQPAIVEEPAPEPIVTEPDKPEFDYDSYRDAVMSSVEANKSYPYIAKRKGQSGLVVVLADIGSDGDITDIRVTESSGFSILDKDAIKLIRSVFPMENRSGEVLKITIPIRYKLN